MAKCLYGPCNNKALRKGAYCYETFGDCARQDAPRLRKQGTDFRSSRVPGQWADQMKQVRSASARAGKAVQRVTGRISGAVKQAQAEVFRMKYPSYEDFVEARKIRRPDAFAGKDHREVRTTTHNLGVYYGVSFPKDCRTNEARCSWLQGWANGQPDPAVREHVRDSIAQALTRDYEAQERELQPLELLDAMKQVRHGR